VAAAEAEFLLVAPEHFGLRFVQVFQQQVVQVHHLVPASVPDQDKETALVQSDYVLDQSRYSRIYFLTHIKDLYFIIFYFLLKQRKMITFIGKNIFQI
jgi:hypothetical protein